MDTILQRMRLYYKKNPVTFVLLFLNTIMFFVVFFNGGFSPESLTKNGGLLPSLVTDNNEYYRLLVSMFLHGGLFHFLMNSYFLYFLGSFTEKLLGSTRYAIIYMISGLGASVAVWLFSDPNVVTIGASGALYGIMGGLLILTFIRANWFSPYGIKSIRTISIINIIFTLTLSTVVSVEGHLGGLVAGIILTYLFIPDTPFSKHRNQMNVNPNNQVHNGKIIIDMDDVTDDDIYTN